MSKKRLAVLVFLMVAAILSNYLVIEKIQPDENKSLMLEMTVNSDVKQTYQIYYSENLEGWNELASASSEYKKADKDKKLQFSFPQNMKYIRIDFGMQPAKHVISDIAVKCESERMNIDLNKALMKESANMLTELENNENSISAKSEGTDPFIIMDIRL